MEHTVDPKNLTQEEPTVTCYGSSNCKVTLGFSKKHVCLKGVKKKRCRKPRKKVILATSSPMDRGFYLKWCVPKGQVARD